MRSLAVVALVLALGSPALAQTGDAPRREAKAAAHKPAKSAAKKRRNDGTDDTGALRCRDVRTHRFAKCGGPYSEPVPAE